jgi:hypothetical protein
VLTAAGRWPEADAALTEAVRLWGLGQRSGLRVGALVRLADLRVRQGRLEEAEQLLAGIDVDADVDAARPLAAIHLARGQTTLAGEVLERALGQVEWPSTAAAPLLALLVDVHLAGDRIDQAEAAAERLAGCAARHGSHYLTAVAALARGRCAWPRAPATRGRACARRWPALPGRSSRWSWRRLGWHWPTPWSRSGPRWRWPRRGPRSRGSSGSRRPATPTPPPRCCARSGSGPPCPPGGAVSC